MTNDARRPKVDGVPEEEILEFLHRCIVGYVLSRLPQVVGIVTNLLTMIYIIMTACGS